MIECAKIKYAVVIALVISGCSKSPCGPDQATNKMLALGKVQSSIVARGGESGLALSATMAQEAAPIGELIAQEKFQEACTKADEIAKKYGIDLAKEQQDMLTVEELRADGGKGSGTCSLEDAARMQMEVHGLLQAEVDAKKRSSDVFRQFNQDTAGLGEMMVTDPSKACELLEGLKKKYKLQ